MSLIDIKTGKRIERDIKDDPLFITRQHWHELLDCFESLENRVRELERKSKRRWWRIR